MADFGTSRQVQDFLAEWQNIFHVQLAGAEHPAFATCSRNPANGKIVLTMREPAVEANGQLHPGQVVEIELEYRDVMAIYHQIAQFNARTS